MSEALAPLPLSAFIIFARIGACMMLMPGLSSPRVPVRARLFIAIGVSLAFMPLLHERMAGFFREPSLSPLVSLVLVETLIGLIIGLGSRLFFLMLEMLASAIAQAIGLSGIAGMPVEESSGEPTMVTFILISATLLFFISDLHLEVLRGLLMSYELMAPGVGFPARFGLGEMADALTAASLLALRLSGPFLVLSIIVNFAFGLANKMTPMIQIYFAAMPVLIGLGFLLMMVVARPFLQGFVLGLEQFLVR